MTDKIPFDVELWKSGKYDVINEQGIVRSITVHEVECKYPINVVSLNGDNDNYTKNGRYDIFSDDDDDKEYDLFLIPKKRKVWIAVMKDINPITAFHGVAIGFKNKSSLESVLPAELYHHIEVELPE